MCDVNGRTTTKRKVELATNISLRRKFAQNRTTTIALVEESITVGRFTVLISEKLGYTYV